MALTRIHLPEHTAADFKTKCAGWLRRKQQKVLAKAMVERIHEMRAGAAEMREPQKSWHINACMLRRDHLNISLRGQDSR